MNEVVETLQLGLGLNLPDSNVHAELLITLAQALHSRFEAFASLDDLADAVGKVEQAIAASRPPRGAHFALLSDYLSELAIIKGLPLSQFDEAIKKAEQGLKLDEPPAYRSAVLIGHGCALARRSMRTGSIADINDAISSLEESVTGSTLMGVDKPFQSLALISLGTALLQRFERTGDLDDLNAAVEKHRMVVELTPVWRCLQSLSRSLLLRFQSTGSLDDLNEIIQIGDRLLRSTQNKVQRFNIMNISAHALLARAQRTSSMKDLEIAKSMADEGIKLEEELGHPTGADSSDALAQISLVLFLFTESKEHLETAMKSGKRALDSVSHDHPERPRLLNNLSNIMQNGVDRGVLGSEELNEAIEINQKAIDMSSTAHRVRPYCLLNLSTALLARFGRSRSREDLDRAVEFAQDAVNAISDDHPFRAHWLNNLGHTLQHRYGVDPSEDDWNTALKTYEDNISLKQGMPTARIASAVQALTFLRNVPSTRTSQDLKRVSSMIDKAVQLLPTASPREIHRDDQQRILSMFGGFAAEASALSIKNKDPVRALQLLEIGRGVMASTQLDMRSDITELEKAQPKLAAKFKFLREELDPNPNGPLPELPPQWQPSAQAQMSRRFQASKEFDDTVKEIRRHPKFERFLLGPSDVEMKAAAALGPIVILNASTFGSHAIIVSQDEIKYLSLPELRHEDVIENSDILFRIILENKVTEMRHNNKETKRILEWLWDVAVERILDTLGFTEVPTNNDSWPRVWWIPVGRLSSLPIHAAGYHSTTGPAVGRSALDRVISSYTPTIRALNHSRDQMNRIRANSAPQTIVLVSTPSASDRRSLEFAEKEITTIKGLLPTSITPIVLDKPKKSDIFDNIDKSSVVHFVCHGQVDPKDPSLSRMLFSDYSFSVADVAKRKLSQAQLAYISACHAANNRNVKLLDESIHMAGAFQLAGFPAVVGTLWQIQDKHSPEIAEIVYRAMCTGGELNVQRAVYGLHFAVREFRKELLKELGSKTSDPLLWAPYIHVGV